MKLVFLAATALMAAPAMAQQTQTDATAQVGMQAGAAATAGTMTAGGYQPAQPPMASQPAPGAPVVFQQAPSPSQAYPAPAPLKSYPICKKGQYDQCRQRGGK